VQLSYLLKSFFDTGLRFPYLPRFGYERLNTGASSLRRNPLFCGAGGGSGLRVITTFLIFKPIEKNETL
jgi:hypothetical protein